MNKLEFTRTLLLGVSIIAFCCALHSQQISQRAHYEKLIVNYWKPVKVKLGNRCAFGKSADSTAVYRALFLKFKNDHSLEITDGKTAQTYTGVWEIEEEIFTSGEREEYIYYLSFKSERMQIQKARLYSISSKKIVWESKSDEGWYSFTLKSL